MPPTSDDAPSAFVLFAHGARDPRWAVPFTAVAARVRGAAPELRFELAYLEHLKPDLAEAARQLASEGARRIRVIPLFFGRGGHLRIEVPRLVEEVAADLPGVSVELASPAGEDDDVLGALAAFCLREARRT